MSEFSFRGDFWIPTFVGMTATNFYSLLLLTARPILKNCFSAQAAFENGAGFRDGFCTQVIVAGAAGCGALYISHDHEMHGATFLFDTDQIHASEIGRQSQIAQELGHFGVGRRDAVDVSAVAIDPQVADQHAGDEFGV